MPEAPKRMIFTSESYRKIENSGRIKKPVTRILLYGINNFQIQLKTAVLYFDQRGGYCPGTVGRSAGAANHLIRPGNRLAAVSRPSQGRFLRFRSCDPMGPLFPCSG